MFTQSNGHHFYHFLLNKSLDFIFFDSYFVFFCSEMNQKKAPGNKPCSVTPLAGKNGNLTFAAVAAGYDKSPGDCVTLR